jgi:ABC-type dipeptide/oligopeptide/nickel transport system permease subunit
MMPARRRWQRFAARREAVVGLAALIVIAVAGLLAPWLSPYDPSAQPDIIALRAQAPSLQHWFGTDLYSRDVLSRVLYGARISLSIGVGAAVLSSLIGTAVGLTAGAASRGVDDALMRLVDAGLSVPRALVLIAVAALWGTLSVPLLTLVLAATGWFAVSRLVRAEVRSARDAEWALAARALGATPWRLWTSHLLPHALAPAIIAATLGVGQAIALEGALSFLGLGVQPPAASWGTIMGDGADARPALWWVVVCPGLALAITVLAVNAVGDGLREALDPREVADS